MIIMWYLILTLPAQNNLSSPLPWQNYLMAWLYVRAPGRRAPPLPFPFSLSLDQARLSLRYSEIRSKSNLIDLNQMQDYPLPLPLLSLPLLPT